MKTDLYTLKTFAKDHFSQVDPEKFKMTYFVGDVFWGRFKDFRLIECPGETLNVCPVADLNYPKLSDRYITIDLREECFKYPAIFSIIDHYLPIELLNIPITSTGEILAEEIRSGEISSLMHTMGFSEMVRNMLLTELSPSHAVQLEEFAKTTGGELLSCSFRPFCKAERFLGAYAFILELSALRIGTKNPQDAKKKPEINRELLEFRERGLVCSDQLLPNNTANYLLNRAFETFDDELMFHYEKDDRTGKFSLNAIETSTDYFQKNSSTSYVVRQKRKETK